jgi:TRAP-type mannitol/chloroaromatic compound transport system permease small subunit
VQRLVRTLDHATATVGRVVAWLLPVTAILCFASVYLRYVLGFGAIWLQELYVWTHVATLMLGAAYVFQSGGFVHVDFLHARFSARGKALVDLLGTLLFMLPFCAFTLTGGTAFFLLSWRMDEASQYETGLANVWLIKASLIAFAVLLLLQALARMLAAWTVLRAPAHVRETSR